MPNTNANTNPDRRGLARVAIVGRPNVGKSTLFNRLIGRRKAIVHDLPGITRDRVMAEADLEGRRIELVDTGGFDTTADDVIRQGIREQVSRAIAQSDAILFVLDCRTEMTAEDLDVAARLRKCGRPVIVVGNKADSPDPAIRERQVAALHRVGLPDLLPVSAEHGIGFDELRDRLRELLPPEVEGGEGEPAAQGERPIAVAVIGRPNVGKSSLTNAILGDERCLVTEIAGTTRDAVDVLYETPKGRYLFVDTAGIRKKGRVSTAAEKLSVVMARKALERCDVALVVVDASEGVSHQDSVVAGYAHESGRSIVILLNKWDLLSKEPERQKEVAEQIRDGMKFLDFAPLLRVSAKSGAGIDRVLRSVTKVHASAGMRVSTAELNRFSERVLRHLSPGAGLPSDVRVYYMTQAGVRPPTFAIFTNAKGTKPHFSYARFLENQIRKAFGFEGTPIRLKFVARRRGIEERSSTVVP